MSEIRRRGLKALFITSAGWREATTACMSDPSHPASVIDEAAFVSGAVELEGSFTAGVVAQALKWAREHDIVGVYAVGEMMVEQTGIVADALGLRSPGLRASRVCRSKYLQRLYCPEWSPTTLIFPPGNRTSPIGEHPGWPAVLKPAGRRSSSGVRRVGSQAELDKCLHGYPHEETLLLEGCVTGQEYSVESLVQGGKVIFESVTRKETNESSSTSFVELAHTVPAPPSTTNDMLRAASASILERLDFADGIAHVELRATPEGRVYLMEIAARTPGDGLLPLYHLATGAPMEPEIIRIALGEPATYPAPARYARQVYLDHDPGILQDVKIDWPGVSVEWTPEGELWPTPQPGAPDDGPALRSVQVLKSPGSAIHGLSESDDRAVTFLIDARTPEELDALEQQVQEAITLAIT
ncbi:acetyl-CoA carboxylase biotin carboxylase subunit family protein [Nonomuraea purpurea]|uniref:Acetyl-CoA carboxylase biotin carboxylase subunit family protein n=1 Tax=Nonomuraea purpurea TaxID=1849276 RepID=A0ABV8G6E5_9ACTN